MPSIVVFLGLLLWLVLAPVCFRQHIHLLFRSGDAKPCHLAPNGRRLYLALQVLARLLRLERLYLVFSGLSALLCPEGANCSCPRRSRLFKRYAVRRAHSAALGLTRSYSAQQQEPSSHQTTLYHNPPS